MLKIAINGPESTGKTALCKELAAYFQCNWEPELARGYIENIDGQYSYNDVAEIAKLQIEQEKKYENYSGDDELVFFDTDLIITKVWFEYKYGVVPQFVTDRLAARFFDFYLLSEPDLPWVYDPVREHGDNRDFFLDWYEKEVIKLGIPYMKIHGAGEKRLQNAVLAVNSFLQDTRG